MMNEYRINADVWSMTLTVLEVALNRYPFPGENEAPLTGPFELLTYLINMDSNFKLQDEIDKGIKYTNAFRDFIKQGLVLLPRHRRRRLSFDLSFGFEC